jgi:hypothetical protein
MADPAKALSHNPSHTSHKELPFWQDAYRGIPNGVLRSALFGAIRRGRRRYLRRETIASVDEVTVIYTGERLDQTDLDVWETFLHIARAQQTERQCLFSVYQLLQIMGRKQGKSGREWVKGVAARLSANTVEIKQGRYSYGGSLVDEFYHDDVSGRYAITINPKLASLYERDGWTPIVWEQRMMLKGQPLAQWLHGFFESHKESEVIQTLDTVYQLCGSENTRIKSFRQELKFACALLEKTIGWRITLGTSEIKINKII